MLQFLCVGNLRIKTRNMPWSEVADELKILIKGLDLAWLGGGQTDTDGGGINVLAYTFHVQAISELAAENEVIFILSSSASSIKHHKWPSHGGARLIREPYRLLPVVMANSAQV